MPSLGLQSETWIAFQYIVLDMTLSCLKFLIRWGLYASTPILILSDYYSQHFLNVYSLKTAATHFIGTTRLKKETKIVDFILSDTHGNSGYQYQFCLGQLSKLLLYCEITLSTVFNFWSFCLLSLFAGLNIILWSHIYSTSMGN